MNVETMNTETMWRVYRDAQAACGLRSGDRVVVTDKIASYKTEEERVPAYDDELISRIGSVATVDGLTSNGVRITFSDNATRYYPYFALEKVATPPCGFKLFDRVLVRDDDSDNWEPAIFAGYFPAKDEPYYCLFANWRQCIAYKGNESLAWTRRKPDENI